MSSAQVVAGPDSYGCELDVPAFVGNPGGEAGATGQIEVRGGSIEGVNVVVGHVHAGEIAKTNIVVGDIHGGKLDVNVLVGDVLGGEVSAKIHIGEAIGGTVKADHHPDETPPANQES